MKHTSFITAAAFLAALAFSVSPVAGQSRAHAASRGSTGGGAVVGHAAPRVGPAPRIVSRGRAGFLPSRAFVPYYGYRSSLAFGLYGYPYGSFGYGYYPYGFGYPYGPYGYASFGYDGYPGYGYPAYGAAGYGGGEPYGSVRIEGPNRDAQVFADGYYVGVVDDFDGTFQHLNLEAGPHRIEIRTPNAPAITFDVNVEPGRTITYRTGAR
jgi:hypothetical protein